MIVQETGYRMLKTRGIELVAVDSPDSFVADTPTAELIRQVLGAVSLFEKAMLVSKLRVAGERNRAANGKCEGRKSHAEFNVDAVKLARTLRQDVEDDEDIRSYREIAEILAQNGHRNQNGDRYSAAAVMSMVNGPQKRLPRTQTT